MYTTTFYSFKGGVGRTLALVNVGVELARCGKRVLLVDFDLEAPGIDTFEELKPKQPHLGIIEYVCSFSATGRAPDVRDYVYEVENVSMGSGRLWIMPAGRPDATYGTRLGSINWQQLYSEQDGYLMIEDLKEQWRQTLSPDYVLVDSRTGHTDVAGICTRQLPDAVVMLFFPNEQNLAGLRKIVTDVKNEANGPRKKRIDLLFAMSNVPDLDDEDQILESRTRTFQSTLGYECLNTTIHRYDSLSLLNQVIFTIARPKSRLANEYRALKQAIVTRNLEDPEAAVGLLRVIVREDLDRTTRINGWDRDDLIDRLRKLHANNGEALYLIARINHSEGKPQESLALLNQAVQLDYRRPPVLLLRAELQHLAGDLQGALADVEEVLQSSTLNVVSIRRALQILRNIDPSHLDRVFDIPAIGSLKAKELLAVANELSWTRDGLKGSVRIIQRILEHPSLESDDRSNAENALILSLIGLGKFDEAITRINLGTSDAPFSGIYSAFNYAIAEWGLNGKPNQDSFQTVIRLDAGEPTKVTSPNYSQCLALAHAIIGDRDGACSRITQAERQIADLGRVAAFSCWRYLITPRVTFLEDCRSIRRFIMGENVEPLFLERR